MSTTYCRNLTIQNSAKDHRTKDPPQEILEVIRIYERVGYFERPCGMTISCKVWLPRIFDQSIHARRNVENPTTKAMVLPSARVSRGDHTLNSRNAQEQCNKFPFQYNIHIPTDQNIYTVTFKPAEETRPSSLRWPTSRVPSPWDRRVRARHADPATCSLRV